MARLSQQHPNNYGTSSRIHSEFSNFLRYINAAELGNKTIAELLGQIYDANGNFAGPVEFRFTSGTGIEYRVGEYDSNGCDRGEDAWQLIVGAEELRGQGGTNCGSLPQPVVATRQIFTAGVGQASFDYALDASDDTLVWVDGELKIEGAANDYQNNPPTGIVFNNPLAGGEVVIIMKIIAELDTGFRRVDHYVNSDTTSFPFEHTVDDDLMVLLNGKLLVEGVSNDYVTDPNNDLVTMIVPAVSGDWVTTMVLTDSSVTKLAGIMMESDFVLTDTGLIDGTKVSYDDGEIPQSKVNGLVDLNTYAATATTDSVEPAAPITTLWIDSSVTPARVMFWDGSQYLPVSGDFDVPTFSAADSLKFLQVDATGTSLRWGTVDLSAYIPATEKGAANGIATLDATGKLTTSQLPSPRNRFAASHHPTAAVADGNQLVFRPYLQKLQIVGFAGRLDAGTCTAEITINGVGTGDTFALSTAPNESSLAVPVTVNALSTSVAIGVTISSAATASNLDVTLVMETID